MDIITDVPVTVVAGTNRKGSLTQKLAERYVALLQEKNIDVMLLSLLDLPADFTRSALYENKNQNPTFNVLRDQVIHAKKFVFIVPEYNGSFPGVLKAFIDGLPLPSPEVFKNKKCALVGISLGTRGGLMALSHLTDILHHLGMHVYPVKPCLSRVGDIADIHNNKQYMALLEEQAEGLIRF